METNDSKEITQMANNPLRPSGPRVAPIETPARRHSPILVNSRGALQAFTASCLIPHNGLGIQPPRNPRYSSEKPIVGVFTGC
jgi:hypothetical protein